MIFRRLSISYYHASVLINPDSNVAGNDLDMETVDDFDTNPADTVPLPPAGQAKTFHLKLYCKCIVYHSLGPWTFESQLSTGCAGGFSIPGRQLAFKG